MALESAVIHLSAFIVAYLSASHISRRKAGFPFGLLAFVVGSLVGCLTAIFVMAFLARVCVRIIHIRARKFL